MTALPRVVRLLVLARAVNRLGAFTLPFLGVLLVTDLGASVATAGWVLAAFGLATIPSRLVGGRLADRLGARRTIVLGLVGTAVGQLLVAAASSLAAVVVAVVLLGLAFEVYEPPSQAMVADVTPAPLRPAAYSLLGTALAVAGVAAGLLAALLAGWDLRWLFVVDAASCLVCAGLVAVLLPPSSPPPSGADAAVRVWTDRRLLAMLACGTGFAVVYLQLSLVLPLTVATRGLEPGLVGLVLTTSAATMALGQWLAQPLLRPLDDVHALTLGYVLLGVGLLVTGFVRTVAGFLAAAVVWSLGDLVLLGRSYAVVAALALDHVRGRYLAVYGTSWGVAGILAPLLGTQLLALGGPVLAWSVLAGLCGALAVTQPLLRDVIRSERSSARFV